MAIQTISRNSFSNKTNNLEIADINSIQIESYNSFWDKELVKILEEMGSVEDSAGNFKVKIGPKFYRDVPTLTEQEALAKKTSYSQPLHIEVTVENLKTKEKKTQAVFAANVPVMTQRGNFIINGIQKVVVNQLVKSAGLIFVREANKGQWEYTARIIPTRGVWTDISIARDGVIYCSIDRKKKFPVTQLLKIFGMDEASIREAFAEVDTDPNISYTENTLQKDSTFSISECVNNVYKKIRPGDIVAVEKATVYIKNLFLDQSKYDFGLVGRYKFDLRLGKKHDLDENNYKRTLSLQEFVEVLKELIRMQVTQSQVDEIDSLGNRRVRRVGEWMANTFRSGLARVIKNAKDKMLLTTEEKGSSPAQIVGMRPLASMIDEFFATSQLARFMEQTNSLSELNQKSLFIATGPGGLVKDRAGFEVRDIQTSFYGRICPVTTPEGTSFGLNLNRSIYSRINKLGFLESQYYKVKKLVSATDRDLIGRVCVEEAISGSKKILKSGQLITEDVWQTLQDYPDLMIKTKPFVSKEIVWLSAEEEPKYVIGQNDDHIDESGHFTSDLISARYMNSASEFFAESIDLVDVSATQILSISCSMVPFISNTEGLRVQMATNMQSQAVPLIKPENPIVATGYEKYVARDSGYMTVSKVDGVVKYADGSKVIVEDDNGKEYIYNAIKYYPSNGHSTINQRTKVFPGERVKVGDILIEGFGIHNGEFAIGQNALVAFMSFKGYNFEDAIIISERLLQRDKFTSTHIFELVCDVHETRIGNEETTRDIPNIPTNKLKKLDENGIIYPGTFVESGDILVGKVTPKGETDMTAQEKIIKVLFGNYASEVKDSSLYLQHGLSGKVISVKIFSREDGVKLPNDVIKRIHIWLATTRKLKPGDKMAGRHGNKSIVSVVLPVEDMPYMEDGTPVDIILNPLGVISRMNLGQLMETHLGLVCHKNNQLAVTQPLNEISLDTIQEELVANGFDKTGKINLYDGESGEKYDRPVTVGYLYMNKLHHLVEDKVHARSTGPYSLINQQPLAGRSHSGGQRLGEMEVWALEAYGSASLLQEMLTVKSDDIVGREAVFTRIIKEQEFVAPNLPNSFKVLANELTALGIKVNAEVVEDETKQNTIDKDFALSVDEGKLS
jgi:DNA-directed RNA polymerase subunit beta